MLIALLLAILWLVVGCADGVLFQNKQADGGVQRLRIDGGESWSSFDTTPRYRSQKAKDNDDCSILLKNEATF